MNPLEQLHKKIDEENWDIKDQDLINKFFLEIKDQLSETGNISLMLKSEKEREAFSFSKSTEGIKWKFQGTRTLEDGTQEQIEWPDIKSWNEDDFQYILQRFIETKNVFLRSEYGTLLFFNGKLQPEQCLQLFQDLFLLSKKYYAGIIEKGEATYHSIYFYNAISLALYISYYKRKAPSFSNELEQALLFIEEVHKNWNLVGKYMLRTIIDLTDLLIQYFKHASEIVDVKEFYKRNNEAAEEQNKNYTWGAIYIIDENIRLSKLINEDVKLLIKRKAELYEKLTTERNKGNLAIVTFTETALRLYKEIDDIENVIRLERQFKNVKAESEYGSFHTQLPKEESERIMGLIQEEILQKNEDAILMNFVFCPMYLSIDSINENADEWKKNAMLSFMAGTSISDKFGNTIARYPGSSNEWAFLQAYSFQFQVGTQSLIYFFIEAFKAGKITENGILKLLKQSWIGQRIKRNYNNQEVFIYPLDIIKPSIKQMINELSKWNETPDYIPDLMTITDSMVLKIEALLRYFCDRLGISTFRLRDDGLVMERNLDEIIAFLENNADSKTNFLEDDRKFIKYVLSEKSGENLRNRIAHGLMDNFEYSIDKTVLAFTIIMRLSKYHFKTLNNG